MDYELFRQNKAINLLANFPYWTLTKSDDKMPIDVHKFFQYVNERNDIPEFFFGATEADCNVPFTSLDNLYKLFTVDLKSAMDTKIFPNATHDINIGPVAFRLTTRTQPYVILDIEPKASDEIRNKFLDTKFLYCETSMSGKGLHMVFETRDILAKYPDAALKPALKSEDGSVEILINHYVTFTGNNIIEPTSSDDSYFYEVFEKLASEAKPPMNVVEAKTDCDVSNIFKGDHLVDIVKPKKSYDSFANGAHDLSKQDMRFICQLAGQLLDATDKFQEHGLHTYTIDELASLLYVITKKHIPYRDKHDKNRSGITWLEYEVQMALNFVLNERKDEST